jgi:hypothetical protein
MDLGMGVEVLTNGFSVYFCNDGEGTDSPAATRHPLLEGDDSPAALRHPLLEGEREAAKMIKKKESL